MAYIKTPTVIPGFANDQNTAQSSIASNSTTPGEYNTVFVAVMAIRVADSPNDPTMSGTGGYNVTFELVDDHYLDAAGDVKLWVYRLEIGASPSAGVVTASFGEDMLFTMITAIEITEDGHYAGVVTGSAASTDTSSNAPSVTLGATPGGSDTVIGVIAHLPQTADAPGAGTNYIRIAGAEISNFGYLDWEYDVDATSTSVPWTTTVGSDKVLIAFTLEEGNAIPGGGGGSSVAKQLMLMGAADMVGPVEVVAGATDVSVVLRVIDSTDGTPETTFDHSAAGIDLWYRRDGAAAVDITEVALAALTTAHTDGGVEQIGDGYVRLDVPDAAFAVGAEQVVIGGTATGMIVIGPTITLTDPVNGLFQSHVITSTSTSALTVADFVGYANDELIGELVWVFDSSANEWHPAWVTDFTTSTGVVTVEAARDGGVLPFTSESGVDRLWRSGFSRANLLSTSVLSDVQASVNTALTAIHLDHLLAADYDPASPPGVATALLNELVESDGGVARFTVNALEQGPSGSGASASAIADAVWDELQSAHTTAGSFGEMATELASLISSVSGLNDLSSAQVASAVWDALEVEHTMVGTYGGNIPNDIAAGVSQSIINGVAIAALNDLDSAAVQAAVNAALIALHLDHLLATTYDPASKPGAADALLNELVENDGGLARFTLNALEQGPSGSGASASSIADAIWDELQADHTTAGTFGEVASEIATILSRIGDPGGSTLAADIGTIDTVVDANAAALAALNDLDSTAVQAATNAALVALHLDHLLAVAYDAGAKPGAVDALLNELVEDDGGLTRFTINALEQGPSGSGASAAAIADAVWDEPQADHNTAGTMGEAMTNAEAGGGGYLGADDYGITREDN